MDLLERWLLFYAWGVGLGLTVVAAALLILAAYHGSLELQVTLQAVLGDLTMAFVAIVGVIAITRFRRGS